MSNIIETLEKEQITKSIPAFKSGDTVVVHVKVKEGTRERLQPYEGVVISKKNRGLNSSFIVRKISHGVGVERTFQTHSPLVEKIDVKRRGDVRKAKLYYLRDLAGRAARIKEKILTKAKLEKLLKVEPVVSLKPEEKIVEKTEETVETKTEE